MPFIGGLLTTSARSPEYTATIHLGTSFLVSSKCSDNAKMVTDFEVATVGCQYRPPHSDFEN